MQQILLNKLMGELAKNPEVKSALGKQDGSIKESYKTNKNAEVIVLESSNLKNPEKIKSLIFRI